MSLQVWLPLNGSLDEKINNKNISAAAGLSLPTAGAIGKLGLGYTFSNSGIKIENIQATSQMSFAMWVKLSSNTFCHLLDFRSSDSNGYQPIYYENGQVQIYSAKNNSGAYIAAPLGDCQWHHLVITMREGKGELYFDGASSGSISGIAMYENTATTLNIGCRHNGNNPCPGIIQDVRVYNHCLSPREVKLLAQGLIAHYKLDGNNHNNLLPNNSYTFSGTTGSGTTIIASNFPYRTLNNTDTSGYKELCQWSSVVAVNANETYTASFLARSINNSKMTVYFWNNNSGVQVSNITSSQGHNKSGSDGNCELTLTSEWQYYWITWKFNSTITSLSKNLLFRLWYGNQADIALVKLEKSNKATPYGLNPNEINSLIEYDYSGYQNHGVCSATLTLTSDTPKYGNSFLFNNNKYIITTHNNFEGMKNTYSIVYWAKHPTSSMNGKMVWGFYDSSNSKYLDLYPVSNKFTLNNGGVGNNLSFNVDCPTDGTWHHYAVVGDVDKVYLYIDGIYKGQTSSLYEIPNAPLVLSGWTSKDEYRWNDGQISDFRLYATALSAAAVKELYQSSIAFLDNGTLQCSEIIENSTNLKYNKNGIVQTTIFNENAQQCLRMYDDNTLQAYQIYEL